MWEEIVNYYTDTTCRTPLEKRIQDLSTRYGISEMEIAKYLDDEGFIVPHKYKKHFFCVELPEETIEEYACESVPKSVVETLENRIVELDEQMEKLQRMRDELANYLEALR